MPNTTHALFFISPNYVVLDALMVILEHMFLFPSFNFNYCFESNFGIRAKRAPKKVIPRFGITFKFLSSFLTKDLSWDTSETQLFVRLPPVAVIQAPPGGSPMESTSQN